MKLSKLDTNMGKTDSLSYSAISLKNVVFHVEQKKPDTKSIYTIWFYLYEDPKQAKLSNGDWNQVGWKKGDWLDGRHREITGVVGMFYILIELMVTQVYALIKTNENYTLNSIVSSFIFLSFRIYLLLNRRAIFIHLYSFIRLYVL